ncbi:MAG: hypothetical protein ABI793_02305 [Flavobacterium sp.]
MLVIENNMRSTLCIVDSGSFFLSSKIRLQNINAEIGFLKGFVLEKKLDNSKTLNEYIKGDDYHLLEKIYDRNLEGIQILEEVIAKHNLHKKLNEFSFDVQNIRNNQMQYNSIKKMTIKGFTQSLVFVFISLLMLLFTLNILEFHFFWALMASYFIALIIIFYQFIKQVKELII